MTRLFGLATAAALISVLAPGVAAASTWVNPLGTGSKAESQAQALPSAPTGVAAACTSPTVKTIKVTWGAVTHATAYTIYKSTTSSSSGFSVTASGVTGTSWTSASLSNGTYWFEVAADIGTHWASANSAASGSHVISPAGCT